MSDAPTPLAPEDAIRKLGYSANPEHWQIAATIEALQADNERLNKSNRAMKKHIALIDPPWCH